MEEPAMTSEGASEAPAASATAADGSAPDAPEPPTCAVCLDYLSKKRELRVQPCGHLYHRTCFMEWMETRESVDDQSCPLCRQVVDAVKNHHGVDHLLHADCLGACGKPTKNQVLINMSERRMTGHIQCFLEAQIEKITSNVNNVKADHDRFVAAGKSESWAEDCKEEIVKLEERKRIYSEMRRVYRMGGMRRGDDVITEWNYGVEYRKLRNERGSRTMESLLQQLNTTPSEAAIVADYAAAAAADPLRPGESNLARVLRLANARAAAEWAAAAAAAPAAPAAPAARAAEGPSIRAAVTRRRAAADDTSEEATRAKRGRRNN